MAYYGAIPNTSSAFGQSQYSPWNIQPPRVAPEIDYSAWWSPAHKAKERTALAEGWANAPGGYYGFGEGLARFLPDEIRNATPAEHEAKWSADYDAQRVDVAPVSGPFPAIQNDMFRMQGGQLQYRPPQMATAANNYSRGSWENIDDSPAIRRLVTQPFVFGNARGGSGMAQWAGAIREAIANPNKGPGPRQQWLGISTKTFEQNRPLLERQNEPGIFGLPGSVSTVLQAALMGAGAGYIGSTVAAGLPQTALTAATAANIATSIPDLTNPNTDIGPLATFASAFLPGGKFIAPIVGAGTGYVSGGPKGAVFGGIRGLGAAYTAGELAAPSATTPSLFIPSTQGVYSGLGSFGTAANLLGSPGGQFLTSIGESLATPTPPEIGALAPAALTTALTAGEALTPSASNVPYTYEPSYTGKALGPSFMNQMERGLSTSGIRSLDPAFMNQMELGTAAPSSGFASLDPAFMNQFERARLGLE
jgi:hypothetical protein